MFMRSITEDITNVEVISDLRDRALKIRRY